VEDQAYGQHWVEWAACEACGSPVHDVEWLSEERTAELMSLAPHTLANWRALRKGPAFSKAGRGVLYARCLVDKYLLTR